MLKGHIYKVCPEGIQPCTMKNRDIYWRRYKKHCMKDNDVSVPSQVGTLGPHTVSQSPSTASSCFPKYHRRSETSFLSKAILILVKPEVAGSQIWAVAGLSHLGDLMFHRKPLHETWGTERACCRDEAANHQLPIAVAFWIIWIVSTEECSNLSKFDADSLLYSLIHFECDRMQQPHWTQAHSAVSSLPTDHHSEVIVHACASQRTLLGCQVTPVLRRLFSSYWQSLDFFWIGFILLLVCVCVCIVTLG